MAIVGSEATDAGKEIVEISSSQTSFDSLLNNFDKMIKLLVTILEYAPNESELTIVALSAYYEDLMAKNQVVINAETALNNLRIIRNVLLYKEVTGIVDVANAVKVYIKSVFGATSLQYKQLQACRTQVVSVNSTSVRLVLIVQYLFRNTKKKRSKKQRTFCVHIKNQENESKLYSLNYVTNLYSSVAIQNQTWVFPFAFICSILTFQTTNR